MYRAKLAGGGATRFGATPVAGESSVPALSANDAVAKGRGRDPMTRIFGAPYCVRIRRPAARGQADRPRRDVLAATLRPLANQKENGGFGCSMADRLMADQNRLIFQRRLADAPSSR